MKLGYWKCRGFAHPIRLLLEYREVKYTYVTPDCGPPPHFDKKDWLAKKYDVLSDYDFPNLPYLEDGNNRLTHHIAIMQYLGRKFNLSPTTEAEHCNVDMIREQVVELEQHLINTMYFPQHRKLGTQPTIEEIQSQKKIQEPVVQVDVFDIARKYSKSLACNEKSVWMAGERLTYIDFLLYEQLDYARNLFQNIFRYKHCPVLVGYMDRFEDLPTISQYLKSVRFNKFPFYGERSYLGRSEDTRYKDAESS